MKLTNFPFTNDMCGVAPAPSQAGFGALAETSLAEKGCRISVEGIATQSLTRTLGPMRVTAASRATQTQPARAQTLPCGSFFAIAFAFLLFAFSAPAADPYISEFLAGNTAGATDSDNDTSDWIEIYNPGPSAVNLQGWYLSNDPAVLTKWVFPNSLNVNSGAYVYVWASNKALVAGHTPDAAGRFHTNFTLSKTAGSNLLLVKPDGTTIINTLAPAVNPFMPYPSQTDNISYGIGAPVTSVSTVLPLGATASYFVPTAGNGGPGIVGTWMAPGFDDSAWNAGSTGIGYDTNAGGTGPLPVEIEPNNTAPTANNGTANFSASSGTKYQLAIAGSVIAVGDLDYYKLGAMDATSGGDVITVTVSGISSRPALTLANPTVELWRNNSGSPVLVTSDADGGPGVDSQILNYAVTIADTYFVKVDGNGGTGTYALSVVVDNKGTVPSIGTTTTAEGEATTGVNETTATATDLSASWRVLNYVSSTNALLAAGDVDFYKFSEVANTLMTFSAISTSGVKLRISVVNSTGTTTLATEDGTSTGQGSNSRIFCYRTPAAGFQYLQVQTVSGSGSYTLEAAMSSTNAPAAATSISTLIGKNIEFEMRNINPSVFVRVPFTVSDLSQIQSLTLRMRYKDGLIAFINGTEAVRNNVGDASTTAVAVTAPTLPPYNGRAPLSNNTPTTPVDYDITSQIANLQVGTNYLGLLGQVFSLGGSTFLTLPEIEYTATLTGQPQYFAAPSPGIANTTGALGNVADTKFSVNRGFYTTAQSVAITCSTSGSQIRYTTNGDAPTATTGTLYTVPLTVSATTVLRAAAFRTGYVPSDVDTQTYIFTTDVVNQQTGGTAPAGWPAVGSLTQSLDYGMDTNITTNGTWGPLMQPALNVLPVISIVTDLANLFNASTGIYANPAGDGAAWERPGSMEVINPNNAPGTQINCGLRVRGGYSRSTGNPKHSFRFFFRDDYRGGGKLKYPLFGDNGAQEFSKMDLRTSQNYSWGFANDARNIMNRDVFFRDLQRDEGKPYTRSVYYHLYLNGQYWGLYQTQERSEAQYGETYFGGDNDEYDTIKVAPDGTQVGTNGFNSSYTLYATDGNFSAWDALRKYCYALLTAPGAPGAGIAQNANYYYIQGKSADGTDNAAYPVLLDVENLQDYMVGNYYGGNCDAPVSQFLSNNRPNNYYAMRRTSPQDVAFLPGGIPPTTRPLGKTRSEGFRFFAHDSEHTILSGNATGSISQLLRNRVQDNNGGTQTATIVGTDVAFDQLQYSNPQSMHVKLMANAEYAQKFADRVQKAFFGNGALTAANNTIRFNSRANQISTAIVAESARWGNSLNRTLRTKTDWTNEVNYLLNTYIPARSDTVVTQLRNVGWFPAATNIGPTFSQYGGAIPSGGYTLTITNVNAGGGVVYYTVNGSDPRLIGGAVNPSALTGTSVALTANTTRVRARVLLSGVWSPMTDETFAKAQSDLRVSELMYNPGPASNTEIAAGYADSSLFEYVELLNSGATALNLENCRLGVGLIYDFPAITLAPGARIILVRNAAAFALRYPGVTVSGQYVGDLDDNGERLVVYDGTGATILDFTYDNKWLNQTDGGGFSLTPLDPLASGATLSTSVAWRASNAPNGSPTAGDTGATPGSVVINELLAYPTGGGDSFVEIRNLTGGVIDLGGWYLSDNDAALTKYRIATGTNLSPNGYLVLTAAANFNNAGDSGALTPFTFNRAGGSVFLSSGAGAVAGGYRETVDYRAAEQGVSFGRYVKSDSSTDFAAQSSVTNGAANSGPKAGTVVINEVHYNPSSGGIEFIELFNTTPNPVVLDGWKITDAFTWTFPGSTTIPGYGYLVVTGGSVVTTRTLYAIPSGISVLGPWVGALDNAGEFVSLTKPGDVLPDTTIPFITVDHVKYNNVAPWPVAPDGSGPSLQRIDAWAYANDVVNWASFPPTAGRLNFDTDGDGIPDAWELANGMNPNDSNDAALDSDGDSVSNYLEYLAGTNPQSTASAFRVETVAATGPGGAFVVTFTAQAGRTYTVQYRTSLASGAWIKLADVAAQVSAGTVSVPDPASVGETNRFYRIVTPAQ